MTEKGGIGGLGFQQDDLTEQALDLHAPVVVKTDDRKGTIDVFGPNSSKKI